MLYQSREHPGVLALSLKHPPPASDFILVKKIKKIEMRENKGVEFTVFKAT